MKSRPQRFEYHVEPVFNPVRAGAMVDYYAAEGWRLVAVAWPGEADQFRDPATGNKAKGPWLFLERECRPEEKD